MSITEVTVPVPSDHVAEFYQQFGAWLQTLQAQENRPSADTEALTSTTPPAEQSLEAATQWWNLLKLRERQLFGLWIDEAPRLLTADSIVTKLALSSPREIPGVLAWPSRKGKKVGFDVRWSFRHDPTSGDPIYGIEDSEYANLIREARRASEGHAEEPETR